MSMVHGQALCIITQNPQTPSRGLPLSFNRGHTEQFCGTFNSTQLHVLIFLFLIGSYSSPPLTRPALLQWKRCLIRGVDSLEETNLLASYNNISVLMRWMACGGSGLIRGDYHLTFSNWQIFSLSCISIFLCPSNISINVYNKTRFPILKISENINVFN